MRLSYQFYILRNNRYTIYDNNYNRYLLTDPKQRTVVICEPPMMPIRIKEMIANILFHRLQVPALCFVPSHLLALLTTGESTGLVVDCGHLETTVLPVSIINYQYWVYCC